ncbi:hypothetical protein D3C76_1256020 [compost metagenome]
MMTLQQVDQRRFANARAAAQRHLQAIRDLRINAAQGAPTAGVSEMHRIETQVTAGRHRLRGRWGEHRRFFTAQLHDASETDRHPLDRHI